MNSITLIGWNYVQRSDWTANLVKDFFWKMNFPLMKALKFVTGHLVYNLAYT